MAPRRPFSQHLGADSPPGIGGQGSPGGDPNDPSGYTGPAGGQSGNPAFNPNDPNLPQNSGSAPNTPGSGQFPNPRGGTPDYGTPFVLSPANAQDFSGNFQEQGGHGGGYTNWAAYLYANPLQQPTQPGAMDGARTPGQQNLDTGLNTAYFGQESQYPGGKYPSNDPPSGGTPAPAPAAPMAGAAPNAGFLSTPSPAPAPGAQDPNQRKGGGFLGSLLQRSF